MSDNEQKLTRRELYDLVWAQPLASVAEPFGLTANGLAKVCDRLGIARPPKGYWVRREEVRQPREPFRPAPEGVSEIVVFGDGQRSEARRPRSRLSIAQRRQQLLDVAGEMILETGVEAFTLKRLARRVGISEAQAHNCFPGRLDLLLALARREIGEVEAWRRSVVRRGTDPMASVVVATVAYLQEAAKRGPLLRLVLRAPDVKEALKKERADAAALAREPVLQFLEVRYAMERQEAIASTAALTALCLRAGGMVASGRVGLDTAEPLCLSLVMAGVRSNREAGDRAADGVMASDR